MTLRPNVSRWRATYSLSVLASSSTMAGASGPRTAVKRSRLVWIRCSVAVPSGARTQSCDSRLCRSKPIVIHWRLASVVLRH